ncbi:MAG: LysR family transcriptional regulator [Eubacteriales bacterium]|nr:LysR family transcriptional regulator [Eubacteriales bacterium]
MIFVIAFWQNVWHYGENSYYFWGIFSMTLNQLRYFCVASRCHSITKAAQELYVTQPTISSAIRELEIEFGISLFYRKGNRLVLTEEGAALYEKATRIIQYCDELKAEYASVNREKSPLRIGIPPMLSTVFFPELSDAFLEKCPQIPIMLEEYGSVRACELVQNDTLDFALVNMEWYNIDKLNRAVLTEDQVMFCVTCDHPLAGHSRITVKELAKEPLIFFNADSVVNELLKTRFEAEKYIPHVVMQSSQIYTTLQFVKKNHVGCFLYSSMVNKFDGIIGIPMDPPIKIAIGIVWKKGKYISNDMQKFLNFTVKYYRERLNDNF